MALGHHLNPSVSQHISNRAIHTRRLSATALGILMLLSFTKVQAQENTDLSLEGGCPAPSTIQPLIHMSITDAFDWMDSLGFSMGDLSDTIYDTVDYFPLRYRRSIFYDRNQHNTQILLMESLDGLSNYVEYTRVPRGECNMEMVLEQERFIYNKARSSYIGSLPYYDRVERYEVHLLQGNDIRMSCKYIDEIQSYVESLKTKARDTVNNIIQRALALAEEDRFAEAYSLIDSMRGYYPPMDKDLSDCQQQVTSKQEQMLATRLDGAIELLEYNTAIALCDSLLAINPENKAVQHKLDLLKAQLDKSSRHFQEMSSEAFDSVLMQLERIINSDIRRYQYTEPQQLTVNFRIYTDRTNESGGQVELKHDKASRKEAKLDKERQIFLQNAIDNLAASPLIQPVKENGIFVITQDDLSANVRWYYSTMELNGGELDPDHILTRFVDTIDRQFFYHERPSKHDLNPDGSVKMVQVPALPTKRVYSFLLTQKEQEEQTYSDIALLDFTTALGDSWLPSILIPGLGTYRQEARGDVVSRALPFYLCLGVSAAGFLWQKNSSDAFSEEDSWAKQNIGNIIGLAGATISGTIYLTDLIQGIGNSFKNAKRSRELRRRLKDGPIMLQSQDVKIIIQQ